MMKACTFPIRTRFTNSFIFRTALFLGKSRKSLIRSLSSILNSAALSSYCRGWSQKDPTYTRSTSGVFITFPMDHINAPYTRISFCLSNWGNTITYESRLNNSLIDINAIYTCIYIYSYSFSNL